MHLQGLAAGTTYHYRVVAVSEAERRTGDRRRPGRDVHHAGRRRGASRCRTGARGKWSRRRTSRARRSTRSATEQGSDIQAAADGDGITYTADSPFVADPAAPGRLEVTQVISTRGARQLGNRGYRDAHDEGPAAGDSATAEYKLFSTDLSLGVVEPAGDTPLPPLPAGSEKTIYLREADGAYRALVTSANVPPGAGFESGDSYDVSFVGASPDLSHVVVDIRGGAGAAGVSGWAVRVGGRASCSLSACCPQPSGRAPCVVGTTMQISEARSPATAHASSGRRTRGITLYLRDLVEGETVAIDVQRGRPAGNRNRTAPAAMSRIFFTSADV